MLFNNIHVTTSDGVMEWPCGKSVHLVCKFHERVYLRKCFKVHFHILFFQTTMFARQYLMDRDLRNLLIALNICKLYRWWILICYKIMLDCWKSIQNCIYHFYFWNTKQKRWFNMWMKIIQIWISIWMIAFLTATSKWPVKFSVLKILLMIISKVKRLRKRTMEQARSSRRNDRRKYKTSAVCKLNFEKTSSKIIICDWICKNMHGGVHTSNFSISKIYKVY